MEKRGAKFEKLHVNENIEKHQEGNCHPFLCKLHTNSISAAKSGQHFCSNEGECLRLTWMWLCWPETPPIVCVSVFLCRHGARRRCVCLWVCMCVCGGGYRPHTVDLCETLPMKPDWMDSFYTCVNLGASPAPRPRLSDPWPSPLTFAGFGWEIVLARHVLMVKNWGGGNHTVKILLRPHNDSKCIMYKTVDSNKVRKRSFSF